jgi:hypothetical protein
MHYPVRGTSSKTNSSTTAASEKHTSKTFQKSLQKQKHHHFRQFPGNTVGNSRNKANSILKKISECMNPIIQNKSEETEENDKI